MKRKYHVWKYGAGWKVNVPFTKGDDKFSVDHIAIGVRQIICDRVMKNEKIRSAVPLPSSMKSNFPEIYGDTMSDVQAMKDEKEQVEREIMRNLHLSCGIVLQPETIPDTLMNQRIEVIFPAEGGILNWYSGTVTSTRLLSGSKVQVEWDSD